MTTCGHPSTSKVIDELGEMQDYGGRVGAVVIRWHYECDVCGQTTSTHSAGETEQMEAIRLFRTAAEKVDRAVRVTRHHFQKGTP